LYLYIINIFKGEALKSKIFLKPTDKTHNAKHISHHLSFLEISLINFACRRRGCSVDTPQGVCIYRTEVKPKLAGKSRKDVVSTIKTFKYKCRRYKLLNASSFRRGNIRQSSSIASTSSIATTKPRTARSTTTKIKLIRHKDIPKSTFIKKNK
jgi:hypothetical protein